ncbi:MAG: PH domain-containing protein [Blastocatellia bacterium]|nr:PH domain-containing protein [Blastocatellia bacterium]
MTSSLNVVAALVVLSAALFFPKVVRLGYRPWVAALMLATAAIGGAIAVWWPTRMYRAWGYRIDDRVLEIRSGVLWERVRLAPLSRLQHVDLHRGPFERKFGLASLVIHTAGSHSASIAIPGIEAAEAVRLRDHLVEIGGDDAV